MAYKIITHDGKAHIDEVLASALLSVHLDEAPLSIERVPSDEAAQRVRDGELSDDTYYLDCGLARDKEKHLFDHHQDRDLPSTALMVFENFFQHLFNSELHDYLKLISRVDNNGPKTLNDFDCIDESRFYFTMSQKLMLKSFETDPLPVVAIFAHGIKDNIAFEEQKDLAREWIKKDGHVELTKVAGCQVLCFVERPPMELITPLRAVDDEIVDTHKVDLIYSFDDRDEKVRSLFRTFHGHEKADFSLSSPVNLQFCHQSGFLMKFIPDTDEEWKDLITASILKRDQK